MERALAAIPSHQPSSRTYQVMIAVMYYGGLRPSETIMLRPRALQLPDDGWGGIDVVEADISFDQSGEPKTGRRTVPIPPVLVTMLRKWIDENGFAADELGLPDRHRQPTDRVELVPNLAEGASQDRTPTPARVRLSPRGSNDMARHRCASG